MLRAILRVGLLALALAPVQARAAKLTLWHDQRTSQEFLEALAATFEKATGHHIDVQWLGDTQLKVTLTKMAVKGLTFSDMVFCPSDFVGMVDMLHLSPVPKELRSPTVAKPLWQTVTAKNEVYGVPVLSGNYLLLFYNRALVPKPATTWDEMAGSAKRLKATYKYLIAWNFDRMFWFAPFYQAFGGHFLDGRTITLATPAMKKALVFYKSIVDRELADRDCTFTCTTEGFLSGKIPYMIDGEWMITTAQERLQANLGLAFLPKIGERPMLPSFISQAMLFPNDGLTGPKQEALKAFARFVLSPKVQQQVWQTLQRPPVDSAALADYYEHADPLHKLALDALKTALPVPSEPEMVFAWTGLRPGVGGYLSGSLTLDQALDVMQRSALDDSINAQALFPTSKGRP